MTETVADFWDSQSRTFAEAKQAVWSLPDWNEGVAMCVAQIAPTLRALDDGSRVLDVGCGIGRLLTPLAYAFQGLDFVGLDISPQMIEHAREVCAPYPNIDLVVGDITSNDSQLGLFDAAYSFTVLQHIDRSGQLRMIRQVASLLRPDGVFRFQWVAVGGPGDTGPYSWPVSPGAMHAWVRAAGFAIETVDADPEIPIFSWMTARKQ